MKVAVKYCIAHDILTCNNDVLGLKSFLKKIFCHFLMFSLIIINTQIVKKDNLNK